ncbi:hypothetical protein MASR2M15_13190 [Anaerolineales bacterium]
MTEANNANLDHIHELIEQENYAEARKLIRPLLAADDQNPDLWMLLAYASENPEEGERALEKVAALDPHYPAIQDLMTEVEASRQVDMITEADLDELDDFEDDEFLDVPAMPPPPLLERAKVDDDFDLDDEFELDDDYDLDDIDLEEDEEASEDKKKRSPMLLLALLGVFVILLIMAAIFLVLSSQSNQAINDPTTAVADNQTIIPLLPDNLSPEATLGTNIEATTDTVVVDTSATEVSENAITPVVEQTEESDLTAEASSLVTSPELLEILRPYAVLEDQMGVEMTELGNTLMIPACSVPGPYASEAVDSIVKALSNNLDKVASGVEAFGVRIVSCAVNSLTLRTVGISYANLEQYSNGLLDDKGLQVVLQPLDA